MVDFIYNRATAEHRKVRYYGMNYIKIVLQTEFIACSLLRVLSISKPFLKNLKTANYYPSSYKIS